MTTVASYLLALFGAGVLAHLVRLPPLVGFLVAGFALNASGVPSETIVFDMANLGVTVLLFTIGLKLDVRSLVKREVWLTATGNLVASVVLSVLFLWLLMGLGFSLLSGQSLTTLALLSFGLSFSSTVFVVKVLEERSEAQSLFGRIAIGVLVIQDIMAVAFMTAVGGKAPSLWALTLVLLWPITWFLRRMWSHFGHGELLVVFGIFMALVPGYAWFEAVGLKGDLGALIVGALLAASPGAKELARALLHIKELLLVAFFVTIGFSGALTLETVLLGLALLLFIPVKAMLYVGLLWFAKLRGRTIGVTSLALANYSEFGLIVAAVGVKQGILDTQWLVVLSIAVAGSFVVSSVVNRRDSAFVSLVGKILPEHKPHHLHPEERPIDIAGAHAVVLGMGRVGSAAYDRLESEYGLSVVGIESSLQRVEQLRAEGRCMVEADATDRAFWDRLSSADTVELAILAMPFHGANSSAIKRLNASSFTGRVVAVAKYDEDVQMLFDAGADDVIQLYEGAGSSVADRGALAANLPSGGAQ